MVAFLRRKIVRAALKALVGVLIALVVALATPHPPAPVTAAPAINLSELYGLPETAVAAKIVFEKTDQPIRIEVARVTIIPGDSLVTIERARKLAGRTALPRLNVRLEPEPSLEEKRALVRRAAERFGIDWRILEAVWQVESGKSWNTARRSPKGATGPMQFMHGTFRKYAQDGDGDGRAEITDAEDAVFAAANLLASAGASEGNIDRALFAYNRASWYVKKVKRIASEIEG